LILRTTVLFLNDWRRKPLLFSSCRAATAPGTSGFSTCSGERVHDNVLEKIVIDEWWPMYWLMNSVQVYITSQRTDACWPKDASLWRGVYLICLHETVISSC
jgi:hypothetical protein